LRCAPCSYVVNKCSCGLGDGWSDYRAHAAIVPQSYADDLADDRPLLFDSESDVTSSGPCSSLRGWGGLCFACLRLVRTMFSPMLTRMALDSQLHKDRSKREPKAPRAPNAWILYRSAILSQMSQEGGVANRKQAELSQIIAERWRSEPKPVRWYYEHEARRRKLEHGPDSPSPSQLLLWAWLRLTVAVCVPVYRRPPRRRRATVSTTEAASIPLPDFTSVPVSVENTPEWSNECAAYNEAAYDCPAVDSARSPWSPSAELSPSVSGIHTTVAHLGYAPTTFSQHPNPWLVPTSPSPPANDNSSGPLQDYTFPPASASTESVHSTPSLAPAPSWWPFRNIRVRRDDADGIELGAFIQNLDSASHVHYRVGQSICPELIDIDAKHE
jgi:HMG (high mobility group) box